MNLWTFFNPENWLADENQLSPCLLFTPLGFLTAIGGLIMEIKFFFKIHFR